LYYQPKPELSEEDILIMHTIDEIYTKCPMYGWPRMTKALERKRLIVNHKRVYRLMKIMGIEAMFPKRNLSKPKIGHIIYPYLLDNVTASYPNHIWGVDITYVRLKKEWLYLVAILDWYSRYVVAWELSDNMNVWFCLNVLENALTVGVPQIHNSDQGSQFTSNEYLGILKQYPIRISMDHRGRAYDNIFTERLWRTIKYEEVYLKDYQSPNEAEQSLKDYIKFYNCERLHQSLKYKTPEEIYFAKEVEK
jgi:putative transposase